MGGGRRLVGYDFALDDFQVAAVEAWDRGESVLVAAPTGSGKTLVAEYAVDAALAAGRRAFYTAPIKALSNQKFRDLGQRLGSQRVGLLTGDNAINGDASVVVMTTEVLRNMIYARSAALDDLDVVVLDEVHFLQDAYRGPVWEEVIINLPPPVRLVCLSATVSNANEVANWLTTVRGTTTAIVEHRRPVQLENLYRIGDRTNDRIHVLPTITDGRPNNDALRIDGEALRGGGRHRAGRRPQRSGRRRLFTPAPIDIVEVLEQRRLLPAIYFIFSRNQCDAAASSVLDAGFRFTDDAERQRIRQIVDARLAGIDDGDLDVLGFGTFAARLEAGIAAHHAGMVPPFKEIVEACFVEGLVKVVFATETLAVGINMPARTVVIDKLTKFTGDHHSSLSPGEFTQLTGRAGRRGMDEIGYAVVPWSPFVPFEQVAILATSRSFVLHSAFRPTYNMAVNLVRSSTSERAHHLLNLSFAQFQADRDVVAVESRLGTRLAQLRELREQATSQFGDIDEYRLARTGAAPARASGLGGIEQALMKLRPGDVIFAEKAKFVGRVAVISVAYRKGGVRLAGVTQRGGTIHLGADDFVHVPRSIGTVDMPEIYLPHDLTYQRMVGEALSAMITQSNSDDTNGYGRHPVEADPQLDERLRAATLADRVEREVATMRRQIAGRAHSVADDFDRVLAVLDGRGYLDGWSLTSAGEQLAGLFHECDLLIIETLRHGLLDDLDPSTMAALCSTFVYEHRSPDDPPAPWFPSRVARQRFASIAALSEELAETERQAGIAVHRAPDPTFVAVAFAWAAGDSFAEVVAEEELSGGDFVRTTKQLVDLLRQIAIVAGNRATRRTAATAAERVFRGVVEASAGLETGEEF